MKAPFLRRSAAGFTLIELIVTIAIAGILLAIVIPSFSDFFSKRRVEGIAAELVTDLQYARTEAVARNRNTMVTFGTACYVVYMSPASASTPSTCTVSDASAVVKSVSISSGNTVGVSTLASLETITFEPVLGSASNNVGANPGVVEVSSTAGRPWKLQVRLSNQGRVKTCSPSGTGQISGYQSDCSDS
jgi:type IV fimbrial biogenesis protein FimT